MKKSNACVANKTGTDKREKTLSKKSNRQDMMKVATAFLYFWILQDSSVDSLHLFRFPVFSVQEIGYSLCHYQPLPLFLWDFACIRNIF